MITIKVLARRWRFMVSCFIFILLDIWYLYLKLIKFTLMHDKILFLLQGFQYYYLCIFEISDSKFQLKIEEASTIYTPLSILFIQIFFYMSYSWISIFRIYRKNLKNFTILIKIINFKEK